MPPRYSPVTEYNHPCDGHGGPPGAVWPNRERDADPAGYITLLSEPSVMWYRWACGGCDYTVWSREAGSVAIEMRSHLCEHYRRNRTDGGTTASWECPYCGATGVASGPNRASDSLRSHLSEHVPAAFERVPTADVAPPDGRLLVYVEGGTAAAALRRHVASEADSLLLVTGAPDERLDALSGIPSPPAKTAVLTTASPPYERADAADGEVEVIRLDGGIGLTDLARELSEVVDGYGNRGGTFYIEFGIVGALVERFGTKPAFKFVNALNAWTREAGAGVYYPVVSGRQPESMLNVLEGLFDRSVRARERLLVSSSKRG